MGILYLVATPIGNLEDISLRAVKTLLESDLIACEDTRRAGILLNSIKPIYQKIYGENRKSPELISYYEQIEMKRISQLINGLKNGLKISLISDAGTPAISDPGFKLVRECINCGIKIISIPGPSALISALVSSGLPTDKFLFAGYPPRKKGNRSRFFKSILKAKKYLKFTIIFYEAPHKLLKTLSEIKEIFGDIEIVIAREMTKIHEETKKRKISEFLNFYGKNNPKGEFTIVLS